MALRIVAGPPAYYDWNGIRWYRNARDGYYRDRTGTLMHHAVWAHEYGPIPDGRHVHHEDHDRANNAPWNLQLLTEDEHRRLHADERRGPRELDDAERSVYSERARDGWTRIQPRDHVCEQCGNAFRSRATYVKFCGPTCRARHGRAVRRQRLGM